MKPILKISVMAAATVLVLMFSVSVVLAAECNDPEGAECLEAEASAASGDTGDTGDTGNGGDGGDGGESGPALAGDGVGGPGGSAGGGGNGGGTGGDGGGGGGAGGSGDYSGATIESSSKTSSSSQVRSLAPSAGGIHSPASGAVAYGGGGGGATSSSGGAPAGGAGGTCSDCYITLGGSDMVKVVSWTLQGPAPASDGGLKTTGQDAGAKWRSAIFLAGLFALILFAKGPFFPILARLRSAK